MSRQLGHYVTLEEWDSTTVLGLYSSDARARDACHRYMLQEKIDCPIEPDDTPDDGIYFNIAVYTINGDEFWTPERDVKFLAELEEQDKNDNQVHERRRDR